jgi:uncharacterized membrane protein
MKVIRIACCLLLLLTGLAVIYQPSVALAQDETEEKVEVACAYPKLEGVAGAAFQFSVEVKYEGSESRYFDFKVTGPPGWSISIATLGEGKQIPGMTLNPEKTYPETVNVTAYPSYYSLPEIGEYQITFEASSGELSDSIELTAIVTDLFVLGVVSSEGLYNTTVTAGNDNPFSIKVENWGYSTIDSITLSVTKPKGTTGWTVEFSPSNKIGSLAVGESQTVDINIKPPSKTIVGDYYPLTISASGSQASAEDIDIRVTVRTSTIWGWVGVGIIVLVIAGLSIIFMRFSRR